MPKRSSYKRQVVRRGTKFGRKNSYASFLKGSFGRFSRGFPSPLMPFQQMRLTQDALIYLDVAGSNVTVNGGAGLPSAWLGLTGSSADVSNGPIATYQFGGTLQVNGLSDLLFPANYQNLFNEYQIDKVDFEFSLECGNSAAAGGGAGQASPIPHVYYTVDPNDATLPATWATVAEFGACKHQLLLNEKGIHFAGVPRVAQQLYVSGLQTSYGYPARNRSLWIDTANPSIATPHYFGKFWVKNMGGSNSGVQIRIQPRVYFSVRRTN